MISSPFHTSGPALAAHGRKRPAHGGKRSVRRALGASLAALVLLVACSRQEEGDRCSFENDDNDCESGLVCINAKDLRGGVADKVSRCCPPEGEPISNERCTPLIGGGGNNAGGQAGETSTSTDSGTSSGPVGASCSYTSDCDEGLACSPQGKCQAECQEDRDCVAPKVCDAGRCIAP